MAKRLLLLSLLPALAWAGTLASNGESALPRQQIEHLLNNACLKKAGQESLLKTLLSTPAAMNTYCGCASQRLVGGLSDDELTDALGKGKELTHDPVWKRRLLSVGLQCLDKVK